MLPIALKTKAVIELVAVVALVSSVISASAAGYLVYKYQQAKHEAIHQSMLASHADALSLAYLERQKLSEQINQLDQESTQRLKVANDETKALAAAVADGKRRLYVAAKCPTTQASTTASMGDGEAPELDVAARPAYYALKDGITKQLEQLTFCVNAYEAARQ